MHTEGTTHAPVYTAAVGGAAGDGIREAGTHAALLLRRLGRHLFLSFEYPSLIRGGHNLSRMSFSAERVHLDHAALDILIATNAESVRLHASELTPEAIVLVEEAYLPEVAALGLGAQVMGLPMNAVAKEFSAPRAAAPSVAIGALGHHLGVPIEELEGLLRAVFSDILGGVDMNWALAARGYALARDGGLKVRPALVEGERTDRGEVLEGNKAVGIGFLAADLDRYIAYPMTPSSSILSFLAKEAAKNERELRVIQPEDEITALNMAIGVAYGGKRVAVGTATGGFALMQEAFSFAGVSESPIAIAVSQRQGPATGAATRTAQADLRFVISSGHGEFPRVVIAPGDPEQAFRAAGAALNLAWKYQTPTIVLLDKQLSEGAQSSNVDATTIGVVDGKRWNGEGTYERYGLTEDGVSPLAMPGTPNASVKLTSYEHDRAGVATDDPDMVRMMQEKRFTKLERIRGEFGAHETVAIHGDANAEVAVLTWGSTTSAVREALKYVTKPVRVVQVLWMEPMDVERVSAALSGAARIIAVELNHNAQLAGLVREKTGLAVSDMVLKYDARPFEPVALAERLNALLA